jgi:hypothetical protein
VKTELGLGGLDFYKALDKKVDSAEGDGLIARWEFGQRLLAEREANGGNQLPHGRLDEIAEVIGKKRAEIKNRMQFAAEYDTTEKVANASATFGSWYEVCKHLGTRAIQSSNSNEWYTPEQYIEAAREVMGNIDLDPASSFTANKNVKASRFYDEDMDGLRQEWCGKIWLNPPYGGLSAAFTVKLLEEYSGGNIVEAILLVNANSTDTQWFQPLWEHTLCFTNHRINFISPGGPKSGGSTHGSAFIYLGEKKEHFAEVFSQFGAVVRRWP